MLIQLWGLDVVMVRVFASSIKYYLLNIRFGLRKDCKIGTYKLVITILSLLHAVFQEWLRTQLYDKRDDFNFHIVNFTYIWSNIPAAPAYGVCISQLIRYFRACGSYQHLLNSEFLLTRKLLNQGISWSHHFESCAVANISWLIVTEHLVYRLTFFYVHDELTLSVRMDRQRCNIQRIAINPLHKHGCFVIFFKTLACFNMSAPPADPELSVLFRI
jgi:hypothetical protein